MSTAPPSPCRPEKQGPPPVKAVTASLTRKQILAGLILGPIIATPLAIWLYGDDQDKPGNASPAAVAAESDSGGSTAGTAAVSLPLFNFTIKTFRENFINAMAKVEGTNAAGTEASKWKWEAGKWEEDLGLDSCDEKLNGPTRRSLSCFFLSKGGKLHQVSCRVVPKPSIPIKDQFSYLAALPLFMWLALEPAADSDATLRSIAELMEKARNKTPPPDWPADVPFEGEWITTTATTKVELSVMGDYLKFVFYPGHIDSFYDDQRKADPERLPEGNH